MIFLDLWQILFFIFFYLLLVLGHIQLHFNKLQAIKVGEVLWCCFINPTGNHFCQQTLFSGPLDQQNNNNGPCFIFYTVH